MERQKIFPNANSMRKICRTAKRRRNFPLSLAILRFQIPLSNGAGKSFAPARKIFRYCAPWPNYRSFPHYKKRQFQTLPHLWDGKKYFRTQIQYAKSAAPQNAGENFRYSPQRSVSKFPFRATREKSFAPARKKAALRRPAAEAAPRYYELNFLSAYKMFSPSVCNVSMHSASESMSPLSNPKPMFR